MSTLLTQPAWHGAAQALVSGCLDLRRGDDAVALMEAVCRQLGPDLYPAFLRVLHEVSRHGDHAARLCVADTLAHGLASGRLPSGRRTAFGGHRQAAIAPARQLGPLEFLCTALEGGDGGEGTLPQVELLSWTTSLLELLGSSAQAQRLYAERLQAQASDPLEGAYSRTVRDALAAMAAEWQAGGSPDAVGARLLRPCTPASPGHWPSVCAR